MTSNLYHEMLIERGGFVLASSFFGINTARTPSLCFAEIFSVSMLSGSVKERENVE